MKDELNRQTKAIPDRDREDKNDRNYSVDANATSMNVRKHRNERPVLSLFSEVHLKTAFLSASLLLSRRTLASPIGMYQRLR